MISKLLPYVLARAGRRCARGGGVRSKLDLNDKKITKIRVPWSKRKSILFHRYYIDTLLLLRLHHHPTLHWPHGKPPMPWQQSSIGYFFCRPLKLKGRGGMKFNGTLLSSSSSLSMSSSLGQELIIWSLSPSRAQIEEEHHHRYCMPGNAVLLSVLLPSSTTLFLRELSCR